MLEGLQLYEPPCFMRDLARAAEAIWGGGSASFPRPVQGGTTQSVDERWVLEAFWAAPSTPKPSTKPPKPSTKLQTPS